MSEAPAARARLRLDWRWLVVGAVAVWLLLTASFTSCSHQAPFHRVPSLAEVPAEAPRLRVILIGDGGQATAESPVLKAARALAQLPAGRTVAVYLGDNIYPDGMPAPEEPGRALAERKLLAQLLAFQGTDTVVYFTPGNHDWREGRPDGQSAVIRAREFIEAKATNPTRFLPDDTGPGPVCVDEAGVRLIFVDTQWWLHEHEKPSAVPEVIQSKLLSCLDAPQALFLTHHPPKSHGVHGGYFTLRDHVFPLTRLKKWAYLPLPIIGSLYPIVRGTGLSSQDIGGEANRAMMKELERALVQKPPLVWAAGHEHNLQVLKGGPEAAYTLVSGSGSKSDSVTDADDTVYAQEALGFMELAFYEGERVVLVVHAEGDQGVAPAFRFALRR